MKMVFLLIFLFVLACMIYGIYAGVSAIGRGIARMGGQQHHSTEPTSRTLSGNTTMTPGPDRDYVAELQALFALRQSGALTADEFAQLKQHLLTEMQ